MRQLFGMALGVLSALMVVKGAVPCVNQTVADLISTNMTLGMALIGNATALISRSCNASNIVSCLTDEATVVSTLSYLYSGLEHLDYVRDAYSTYFGFDFGICLLPTTACSCSAIEAEWNTAQGLYNNDYSPAWDQFVNGNVANCTEAAESLAQLAYNIYCKAVLIARRFERCRSGCQFPCCEASFATHFNDTVNSAMEILHQVNQTNAPCSNGSVSCFDPAGALTQLALAETLLTGALDDLVALYDSDVLRKEISCALVVSGVCNCSQINGLLDGADETYNTLQPYFTNFTSGISRNCNTDRDFVYYRIFQIRCYTINLIQDFSACKIQCPCFDAVIAAQANITNGMTQAMSYIGMVWNSYNAQCAGNFSCTAANITLVQEDLTQAISYYDLAIGNYTAILQDSDYNATCTLPPPECGCRLLGNHLQRIFSTYYLDYLPLWQSLLARNVTNCISSAKILRGLVLEQKCLAEDLLQDYGVCYQRCQTNWCLYYNCTCLALSASGFTPKPSRWLRDYQLLNNY